MRQTDVAFLVAMREEIEGAAAAAQFVLDRYWPRRVVNVGMVGCLDSAIGIGEVHSVSMCAFFDVDATVFGFRIGQIPRTSVHEYSLVSRQRGRGGGGVMVGNPGSAERDALLHTAHVAIDRMLDNVTGYSGGSALRQTAADDARFAVEHIGWHAELVWEDIEKGRQT